MFDLVIRRGTVVDGTGAPARPGVDVAITAGRIAEIGGDLGPGRREIDADGRLVTPGFVDIHTHYDGQATWDPVMAPSSWHGVTTAVMGNCGVGFAPASPDRHEWLIGQMEGVEDIPGAVLEAGIDWSWETFPEYLDALDRMDRTIDIATQVPHGSVRAYVMGDRGARNESATPDDIEAMARIVHEGMRAGALGFTTSRTVIHRGSDGECMPGTFASRDEIYGLGLGMARSGHGVFEVASDLGIGGLEGDYAGDAEWMSEFAVETGLPVFYLVNQVNSAPEQWRLLLAKMGAVRAATGAPLYAMVAVRPPGVLMSLEGSMHPFKMHPTYIKLDHLPLDQLVAELRKPETKAQILGEQTQYYDVPFYQSVAHAFHTFFSLGDPPNYEPAPEDSVGARAQRAGRDPYEFCYDELLERGGKAQLFMAAADYADGNFDSIYERLQRDDCIVSLSDAGAHAQSICDASISTFLLTHWARDRTRGPKFPVEFVVKRQTSDTARLYGLNDRGVLAPGYRADVNVIDFDALRLYEPRMEYDMPTGAGRLLQKVDGFATTIVNGTPIFEDGEHTGELPGRLIRGPQHVGA